jgi:hypothetical protein
MEAWRPDYQSVTSRLYSATEKGAAPPLEVRLLLYFSTPVTVELPLAMKISIKNLSQGYWQKHSVFWGSCQPDKQASPLRTPASSRAPFSQDPLRTQSPY